MVALGGAVVALGGAVVALGGAVVSLGVAAVEPPDDGIVTSDSNKKNMYILKLNKKQKP